MRPQTILYTGLFLDQSSKGKLFNITKEIIDDVWPSAKINMFCDHMTSMFYTNIDEDMLKWMSDRYEQRYEVKATHIGYTDKALAIRIETEVPSTNAVKHITLATNVDNNGKPVDSNDITNWEPLEDFPILYGSIQFRYK